MPSIIQTKSIDGFLKSNSSTTADNTKKDTSKEKILKSTDWIDLIDKDGYIYAREKKESVIILPYDKNLYDEIRSVYFIRGECPAHDELTYYVMSEQIEEGESKIDCVIRALAEEGGITIPKEDVKKRILEIAPLYVSKGMASKIYPFFVNVADLKKETPKTDKTDYENESEFIEVNILDLPKYKMMDIQLLYMISIIKEVL